MIINCANSGSKGNCYSVTDDNGKVLLLDAGVPLPDIKRLIKWKVGDVVSVFVSHGHL